MSLNLDNLTLFCLDTRSPDLAVWAIEQCHTHARFAKTVLMTDLPSLQERHPDICYEQAPEIHSVDNYSIAMLTCMLPHIEGSHALVLNQANESQRSPTGAAPIRRRLHPVEPAIGSRFLVGGVVLSS